MARSLSCPFCGSAYLEPVREGEGPEVLCGVCRSLLAAPVRASLLRRVAVRKRRAGFIGLARLAAARVIDVRRYLVYTTACVEAAASPPPAGVEIGPFHDDDLDALCEFVPRSELKRRLRRGERGIVARVEGRPVGCVWVATEPRVRRFPVPIELGDDEAYADGLYVRSVDRSRGIGLALSLARRDLVRSLGFGRVVAHVRIENAPARSVQLAQGSEAREEVIVGRLFGRSRMVLRRPVSVDGGKQEAPAR